MSKRLNKKVSIVTGGNTGIGRAISLALAAEGSHVIIGWNVYEKEATILADEIKSLNVNAKAIQIDVTNENSVKNLVKETLSEFGQVDILINNAGIQKSQPIGQTSLLDWDSMQNVHLRGAFLCAREVSDYMIKAESGSIINVCSQLGYIGRANYTAYSAAKGGLIAFTRALAKEFAPFKVRVNGVCPGLVDTGFDPLSESEKSIHAASLPMKRLGYPSDMTSAFIFLASDEANYYCGQFLHPNGGEIMP